MPVIIYCSFDYLKLLHLLILILVSLSILIKEKKKQKNVKHLIYFIGNDSTYVIVAYKECSMENKIKVNLCHIASNTQHGHELFRSSMLIHNAS